MSNASKTSKAIALPKPGVLLRYEAACRAVAEAKNVLEVLPIRNKALAMKLRAQLAKDKKMRAYAMAIAWRAERRLGQIMKEQAKAGSRAPPGRPPNKIEGSDPISKPPSLAKTGIDKNLAKRARRAAEPSDEEFEEIIEETFNPPPKPREHRWRRVKVYKVMEDTPLGAFQYHAGVAISIAESDYSHLVVDDEVLTLARRAAEAWATCVKQMEERRRAGPSLTVEDARAASVPCSPAPFDLGEELRAERDEARDIC